MREIRKGHEPVGLTQHRCDPGATFKGLPSSTKESIQKQLLKEQGHICAYCMKRINKQQMKVEHWHCQDKYPDEQLDYQNMLGACLGHEGEPYSQQTCDTRKGNQRLKYNPADPSRCIESRTHFLGNGKIQSDEIEDDVDGQISFDRQLNEVLNLNHPRLVKNRMLVWNAVHDALAHKPGSRTSAEIQKLLDQWNRPNQQGQLREYCAVAVYYLRKRLKRLEKPTQPNAGR